MIIVRRGERSAAVAFPAEDNRLGVSRLEMYLGPDTNQNIRVSWRFTGPVNLIDWIGMYDSEESDPMKYADYKSYGVVGRQTGEVTWSIPGCLFTPSTSYINFRYFDGLTGSLRAVSPSIFVSQTPRLLVTGLSCRSLPLSRHSSVIARLTSGRETRRTGVGSSAEWDTLDLDLPLCDSAVTVRIEDALTRKALLEASVPVQDIIDSATRDLNIAVRTPLTARKQNTHVILSVELLPQKEPLNEDDSTLHDNTLVERMERSSLNPTLDLPMERNHKMTGSLVSASSSSGSNMSQSSSGVSMQPSTSGNSLKSPVGQDLLPDGWEARMDRAGRTFYVDHRLKRTQWHRPGPASPSPAPFGATTDTPPPLPREGPPQEGGSKKYHFIRRTVASTPPLSTGETTMKFLGRADFITLLHANQTALRIYNASPVLKHVLHRIRRGGESIDKYEHNSEFVSFVNAFADDTQPLPDGWTASGTQPTIFISHASRRTTLLDPRLPLPVEGKRRGRRARSEPPQRREHDLNGNFLDILQRSEEIAAVVEKRAPELAVRVRRKLRLLDRMGEAALVRLANDVDLIMAISMLDSDEPSSSSELDEKLGHFHASLQRNGYGKGPSKLKLRFSRDALLRDAFDQILSTDAQLLRKARLSIAFDDEDGLDYGGPSRELFFLLSRELFNPYYGLFEYSAQDRYTVQINPMSIYVDNYLQWMELAGRVLGLALVHRCLIDTFFTRTFYKMLLEQQYTLSDLSSLDPEFHSSLCWIRDNPVDEAMQMTFSTTHDVGGEIVEKELLPNGKDLPVTSANKDQFIRLMVRWRAERGVEAQGRALLRGLHQIIERDFLRVFSVEQLEVVLSGTLEIDLQDWRDNTEYRGGYFSQHIVVEWFWDTVEGMSNADRLKLLQFVTGTSSVPYEGFRALRGSNGAKKFTIERWGEESALPRAHTCFNRLDLPCYPTKHILKEKLFTAINEGMGYAIE